MAGNFLNCRLVLGLQGGKIAFVMLADNQKQETSISTSDIIVPFSFPLHQGMHVVEIDGQKQLIVVFQGGEISSYSFGDFNRIHTDNLVGFGVLCNDRMRKCLHPVYARRGTMSGCW